METRDKERFENLWTHYFGTAELPIIYYFTDNEEGTCQTITNEERFIISDLARVRKGSVLVYDVAYIGCKGGILYTGIGVKDDSDVVPWARNLQKVIGEKKNEAGIPVGEQDQAPTYKAPAKYLVFKRWDKLKETDNPEIVVFFCTPDVLSGLFLLSNYRKEEPNMAISPGASGCGSVLSFPYLQKDAKVPLAVIGMLDPSARVFLEPGLLSFSIPQNKFLEMVDVMEEGILDDEGWEPIRKRINLRP